MLKSIFATAANGKPLRPYIGLKFAVDFENAMPNDPDGLHSKRDYNSGNASFRQFGMQGWRSGENTRFPLMWSGFDSQIRGVICGLGLLVLYSAPRGFFPGIPVFTSP